MCVYIIRVRICASAKYKRSRAEIYRDGSAMCVSMCVGIWRFSRIGELMDVWKVQNVIEIRSDLRTKIYIVLWYVEIREYSKVESTVLN